MVHSLLTINLCYMLACVLIKVINCDFCQSSRALNYIHNKLRQLEWSKTFVSPSENHREIFRWYSEISTAGGPVNNLIYTFLNRGWSTRSNGNMYLKNDLFKTWLFVHLWSRGCRQNLYFLLKRDLLKHKQVTSILKPYSSLL